MAAFIISAIVGFLLYYALNVWDSAGAILSTLRQIIRFFCIVVPIYFLCNGLQKMMMKR